MHAKRKMLGLNHEGAAFPKIEVEVNDTAKVEIKFNSKNKYQVSVHKQHGDENKPALLLMKGRPSAFCPAART